MQKVQQTWAGSLSQEDPLQQEIACYQYSFLKIPWTEKTQVGYSPFGHKESDTTGKALDQFRKVQLKRIGSIQTNGSFSIVLLECSPRLFVAAYCLWLLLSCICCLQSLQWKSCGPQVLKYLLSDRLKKIAKSCPQKMFSGIFHVLTFC